MYSSDRFIPGTLVFFYQLAAFHQDIMLSHCFTLPLDIDGKLPYGHLS